jgi:selenocysteine lyase/cysteine desulfurase
LSIKSAEKIFEARQQLADLFGSTPENVVFTYNTTYALNIAIKAYVKYSTHILISDIEHNSVLRPVHQLYTQKLCTYDIFSTSGSDEEIVGNIEKSIKKDTSMLVCTHMSNICSRRLPLQKIGKLCKEKGIYFIVDAAQSAGLYDIDIKNMCIDALCVPGHKSLYGPQGIGVVVFSSDAPGRSIFEGGTGINSLEIDMPDVLPERYEAGTLSTPLIAGLSASLKWLEAIEQEKIRQYEEELYLYLVSELEKNEQIQIYQGCDKLGNTLIFNLKGFSATTVSGELDKRGICTRSGLHCAPLAHKALGVPSDGAVRASLSVFNSKTDINALSVALEEISKQTKKEFV